MLEIIILYVNPEGQVFHLTYAPAITPMGNNGSEAHSQMKYTSHIYSYTSVVTELLLLLRDTKEMFAIHQRNMPK